MTAHIREAIILPGTGDPLRRVARVPLLVRTILALERAGIERCTLIGPLEPPVDGRIHCTLATAPVLEPRADGALRLIVEASTVIDATLVRELQARARPGEVLELETPGARVRVAPGPRLGGNGGVRLGPVAGTLRPADAPGLEHSLLLRLENPHDGYLDRLLHRRLSRPLTRLLLPTGISPNLLSVIGIALGVAGGLVLGLPGLAATLLAVVLLEASAVLDCSDGELARIAHAESRLGHWLDVSGDTLVHLALLGGIAARISAAGTGPTWSVLALLGTGVLGAFAVISWSDATAARRRHRGGWEDRVLDGVLSPLTTRDWYVFPVAFALAGRLDVLVPAAAVGAHVFWVTTLVLLVRSLRRARV